MRLRLTVHCSLDHSRHCNVALAAQAKDEVRCFCGTIAHDGLKSVPRLSRFTTKSARSRSDNSDVQFLHVE